MNNQHIETKLKKNGHFRQVFGFQHLKLTKKTKKCRIKKEKKIERCDMIANEIIIHQIFGVLFRQVFRLFSVLFQKVSLYTVK